MSAAISDSTPRALAVLLHHRWTLPILAQVAAEGGCKFVTLHKRLGVSPQSLKLSLRRLAMLDLVVPNSGYGHPLRPEYILGETGTEVAVPARALWQWISQSEMAQPMLKKWCLPTLAAVSLGAQRFNEIRTVLAVASPRATTLALKDLVHHELAARRIADSYPPAPYYLPTAASQPILLHLCALGAPIATSLPARFM